MSVPHLKAGCGISYFVSGEAFVSVYFDQHNVASTWRPAAQIGFPRKGKAKSSGPYLGVLLLCQGSSKPSLDSCEKASPQALITLPHPYPFSFLFLTTLRHILVVYFFAVVLWWGIRSAVLVCLSCFHFENTICNHGRHGQIDSRRKVFT